MRIVLVRHGITVGGLYGAYVGITDQPLCTEGKEELVRKKKTGSFPVVDMLVCSPMRRCLQTAAIYYPNMQPQTLDELKEQDFGKFEGLSQKEIRAVAGYETWGSTPAVLPFPGGEAWDAFASRSRNGFACAVAMAVRANSKGLAVVCHGGTIMAVMEAMAKEKKGLYYWECNPGDGYLLDYDRKAGKAEIIRRICP